MHAIEKQALSQIIYIYVNWHRKICKLYCVVKRRIYKQQLSHTKTHIHGKKPGVSVHTKKLM